MLTPGAEMSGFKMIPLPKVGPREDEKNPTTSSVSITLNSSFNSGSNPFSNSIPRIPSRKALWFPNAVFVIKRSRSGTKSETRGSYIW